jgi:hypothetical protein
LVDDALWNYSYSDGIVKTKTPAQFLSKLLDYLNGPLDKYGKPKEEKKP